MTDKMQQHISELIDNELSSSDSERLLQMLKEDQALRDSWGRYHLIRDVIRGERTQTEVYHVADRVREKIADEPAIISTKKPGNPKSESHEQGVHWLKPALGVALAASVSGAAIMVMPDFSTSPVEPQPMQVASSNPSIVTPTVLEPEALQTVAGTQPAPKIFIQSGGTRWKNLQQPEVESKLNRYLVDHNELASPAGISGVLPYTSFVSYDAHK